MAIMLSSSGDEIKKSNNYCLDGRSYMDKYNDYIGICTWLELKYKETRESHSMLFYEGELKENVEYCYFLYDDLIKQFKGGPCLVLPLIPKVCWYCECMCFMCRKRIQCGCVYGINCQPFCPFCGCTVIVTYTDGTPCSTPQECAYYCLNSIP